MIQGLFVFHGGPYNLRFTVKNPKSHLADTMLPKAQWSH